MPRFLLLLPALLLLAACGDAETPPAPPDDWHAEGDRWWRDGADTTVAFRDLSDFETMGLGERPDGLSSEGPVVRNMQRRALPFYRNHPELADSIFHAVGVPMIEREMEAGDADERRDDIVRRVNLEMVRVLYPPRFSDENPPLIMPDSLVGRLDGTIEVQVYVGADRRAHGIQLLQGVHPTMDAIVMRRFADGEWLPARLLGEPVDSWYRAQQRLTLR